MTEERDLTKTQEFYKRWAEGYSKRRLTKLERRMENLKGKCQAYMEFIKSDDYVEDRLSDYEHDIFEAAMEAVFGGGVWKDVNDNLK